MGLKVMWMSTCFMIHLVKIRPLWDWKYLWLPGKLQDDWLKSDHYGIERLPRQQHQQLVILLKSDHYGIERWMWICNRHNCNTVKIRPLWDWKRNTNQYHAGEEGVKIRPLWDWKLDKDGGGIPAVVVKIRPLWDWKIFGICLSGLQLNVKIRPLWDWK